MIIFFGLLLTMMIVLIAVWVRLTRGKKRMVKQREKVYDKRLYEDCMLGICPTSSCVHRQTCRYWNLGAGKCRYRETKNREKLQRRTADFDAFDTACDTIRITRREEL